MNSRGSFTQTGISSRPRLRELTCGFAVLGVAQVAQGTFVVAEVIEGDPCPVHGLEVVPLMAQHLQAVLLHSLIVDQLRLQQASCGADEEKHGGKRFVG